MKLLKRFFKVSHVTYECALCKETRTFLKPSWEQEETFIRRMPMSIVCGYRGCTRLALRTDNYLNKVGG